MKGAPKSIVDRKVFALTEIDAAELAVRMCEANYGLHRPTPSARHALEAMEPEVREAWLRSAKAAMTYWQECVARLRRPS